MEKERIAFFGSPSLAHVCLKALHSRFHIPLVVTQPDRERGRGRKVSMTPVKQYALEQGLAVYQSADLGEGLEQALGEHGITLNVVVAFGRLLRESIIDFPERGSVNLHASLLPKYRGASPIEAAILNGERETGITLQRMKVEMDQGAVLAQMPVAIDDCWTARVLHRRIEEVSPSFLSRSVTGYIDGRLEPVPQDESKASYCGVIRKEDGRIEWRDQASDIRNKIRAYDVWPVAFTFLKGRRLRLYNARVTDAAPALRGDAENGQVIRADKKQGIVVKTGNGYLGITELQMENKRRMDHVEFMNGHRDLLGSILGAP
jgi:methionyl-tRNA formyltransferase